MNNDSTKKFQLGLVYLFGLLALLGIGPFVILRYLNGQTLHALLDLAIVLAAMGNAGYSYWRGEVPPVSLHLAAGFYTLGAIAVVYLNSPIFVFWVFPTVLSNFFLLRPRTAVIVNLLAIACIIPIAMRLGSTLDSFGMLSSLLIGSTMAYLFARLTEQQRHQLQLFASQDALTLLGNRRAMDEELQICIDDFMRHKTPATLIVFDLDFFKNINDRFGHSVGDNILVQIGSLLLARLRKTDRAFRFGGEEFVLLARNTTLAEAANIAEQIRAQIHSEIAGPDGYISASFGCACIATNESREQWFIRADRAMYSAKIQGRNRVVLADDKTSLSSAIESTNPCDF